MMQRYVFNPEIHQPIYRYMVKTCIDCHEDFERPSNWRKTQKCPRCAAITQEYILIARRVTKNLLKTVTIPDSCQECGKITDRLKVHHIIPLEEGGGPGLHNIEFLCHFCHVERHNSGS